MSVISCWFEFEGSIIQHNFYGVDFIHGYHIIYDLFYTIFEMKPVPTTIQLFLLNAVSNSRSYKLFTVNACVRG